MEYSSLPTTDLSFATPNTKQLSSIESVNTPRNPINNIPETPNLHQKDINSKESISIIIESQTFNDDISEKIKIERLKTEIISSLESTTLRREIVYETNCRDFPEFLPNSRN